MRFVFEILAALILSGCYNEALPLKVLIERQEGAIGWVHYLDCGNHGAVYYRFEVNGKLQGGKAPAGMFDCRRAKVGDPVKVYYDRENPSLHTLLLPSQLYEQERGWFIPAWIGVPLIFILINVLNFVSIRLEDDKKKVRAK